MLPSEASGDAKKVEEEKERIRNEVLARTNTAIVANDADKPVEERTMTLLRALGSDLNINAFALNWRHADGTLNTDVEEANYLMNRVVSRLSVDSPDDKPTKIPLYLTSTEFSREDYGRCAATFKRRLGLEEDSAESLMVLRNVVMSPLASLSTRGDFINMLGDTFKKVAEEEVKVSTTFLSFLIKNSAGLTCQCILDLPDAQRRHGRLSQLPDAWDPAGIPVVPIHVPRRQASPSDHSRRRI